MLELSQSRPAWDRMIDPTRGVVVVDFFDDASGEDPRADAEGRVQLGQLLCGPELAAELDRMHKELEWRVGERDPEYGPTFWCNRYNCSHGAEMEFDHNGGYNFVAGPNGPVLDHVVRIEGGPVIEEFSVEGSAFARGEIARLANARCG